MKVLFGMPLRQTTGFVESLLRLVGLDWVVPDFSTLCRRQKALNVGLPYRGGTGPLNLLIDSTGIKAPSRQHPTDAPAGQWKVKASGTRESMAGRNDVFGARYTSTARQANDTFAGRGMDEETLEVRAVEVTTRNVGDAPMLPELLDQIPPDQNIGSVTAPSRQIAAQSPAGQWKGPTILENATTRLLLAMLMLSFHRARTPSHGSPRAPEPPPGTKP